MSTIDELNKYEYFKLERDSLKQQLSDSEADWIKMRDYYDAAKTAIDVLAQEKRSADDKLKQAIEVIKFYENCNRLMISVRDLPVDRILGRSIYHSLDIADNGETARLFLKKVMLS